MSELRRDPITGRWVIVDTGHPNKPQEYEYEMPHWRAGVCPFCYGNEAMTPPEVDVIRDTGTRANTPGWQVRVVSNKFPALQIEGDLARRGLGMYDLSHGVGAHEVIIETPDHHKDMHEYTVEELERVFGMYCNRINDLSKDKRFKYVMVFKNFGPSAGASLEHPHTQLIALPMVPKNVQEEIKGATHYLEYKDRCIFCDLLRQELDEKDRIILENQDYVSFCPYVSRFPFEFWIMPKAHRSCFCSLEPTSKSALAVIFKATMMKLKTLFPGISYNFIIHSNPLNGESCESDSYHWHIEFMPQLTRVAGFEWGTGFYCVPTPPEMAAQYMRDIK